MHNRIMELIINKPEELEKAVNMLLDFANGRKKMAFYGEIGAGKTTFIQAFCRRLEVEETVTSPTFAIVNEYSYLDGGQYVYHIDLYRLKDVEEALNIGIENYLYDDHYCLIEWPEFIEPLLPEDVVKIKIELYSGSKRKIFYF